MESIRPIRSLMRGLDALALLNLSRGVTVSELAAEIKLPRTTVYRILETLTETGFAFRDAADERYRLTILVRRLSAGFTDEAWVAQVAAPLLHELGRDILWPVALSTLSGASMMTRATTDHATPLAMERYSAGWRAPLTTTAVGRTYLAHCPSLLRESLIDSLPQGGRDEFRRLLTEVKSRGYATSSHTKRSTSETSLAVPLQADDRSLAVLSVRFLTSAAPLPSAIERFLPKLRRSAAKIALGCSQRLA